MSEILKGVEFDTCVGAESGTKSLSVIGGCCGITSDVDGGAEGATELLGLARTRILRITTA